MKKTSVRSQFAGKLRISKETVRVLTEHQLSLVAAGACADGSGNTKITPNAVQNLATC